MNYRKSRAVIAISSLWLVGLLGYFWTQPVSAQLANDLNEGSTFTYDPLNGDYSFSWWGKAGRTYFVQHSEDLINWHFVPIIKSGIEEAIEYGFTSTAPWFFLRLRHIDVPVADADDADFDGDGVSNRRELDQGTNPFSWADSDNDHMPDDWEYAHGLSPNDPSDANQDQDSDGVTNLQAYLQGWDPQGNPSGEDSDGDDITDAAEIYWELRYPGILSPTSFEDSVEDFDGDNVLNFEEILYHLDPGNPNTHSNGGQPLNDLDYLNQVEDLQWTWPYASADVDGDGMFDSWEHQNDLDLRDWTDAAADPDDDDIPNYWEFRLCTNPHAADGDGDYDQDGYTDSAEIAAGSSPVDPNSNPAPDSDIDGDGWCNQVEIAAGTDPASSIENPQFIGQGYRLESSVATAHDIWGAHDFDFAWQVIHDWSIGSDSGYEMTFPQSPPPPPPVKGYPSSPETLNWFSWAYFLPDPENDYVVASASRRSYTKPADQSRRWDLWWFRVRWASDQPYLRDLKQEFLLVRKEWDIVEDPLGYDLYVNERVAHTEIVTLTLPAGQTVGETFTYAGYPPADDNTHAEIFMMPFEFVTQLGAYSTIGTEGIGVTNQEPQVQLNYIDLSDVDIDESTETATVNIGGSIVDAIMDNVPGGKGADIETATIFIDGEFECEVPLTRQEDGTPTLWRNYPALAEIQTTQITVPAQGISTIRVETAPNAAGIKGSSEVSLIFQQERQPGALSGGYARYYTLTFASAMSANVQDTVTVARKGEQTSYILTETDVDSRVFESTQPGDPDIAVRLIGSYQAQPTLESLDCRIIDSATTSLITGSGGKVYPCVETTDESGVFLYSEIEPGIRSESTYTHRLRRIDQEWPTSSGGNHPFTWRIGRLGNPDNTQQKLGAYEFPVLEKSDGYFYPKLDDDRMAIAFLVRADAEEATPGFELLFYDAASDTLVRQEISEPESDLKLTSILEETEIETTHLQPGGMTFIDSSGLPVSELDHIPAQTLIDLIEGDESIEIAETSWEKVRVVMAGDPSQIRVRIASSEINTDYFDLMANPAGVSGKVAALQEISPGVWESEDKIIVYKSSPGIPTLSFQHWLALKNLGYLVVHNQSERSLQRIADFALDNNPAEPKQDHHLFNQWQGDKVLPRYKNFWSKVFDPGKFDVHDFTVEVAAIRHQAFNKPCTEAWKLFIESVTDANGDLLPNLRKEDVRRSTINKAFELAEQFHVDIKKVRFYPRKAGKIPGSIDGKPLFGSKLNDLIKLDHGGEPFRWNDPTDLRTERWRRLCPEIEKAYGKKFFRSLPFLGWVMTGFMVAHAVQNPAAAIAEELNISEECAQLLIEGKVGVTLAIWAPDTPTRQAQLKDGSVIYVGMPWQLTHLKLISGSWIVEKVEEGELFSIQTTGQPGVVTVQVKVGQMLYTLSGVYKFHRGVPEVGKLAPLDFLN